MSLRPRPAGIVLISIYDAFAGLVGFLLGLVGGITGQFLSGLPSQLMPAGASALFTVLSILGIGLGIVTLAAAYGMWNFLPWGWTIQKLACVADIILNALYLLVHPISAGSIFAVAGLAIDIGILLYISQSDIRDLYETASSY